MYGAKEFASLFCTGQYGHLYLESGTHARGKTFHIYVLPVDMQITDPRQFNNIRNSQAVEVYGITGGQPGWTESYGWLHIGPWQQEFQKLVIAKNIATQEAAIKREQIVQDKINEEERRVKQLLHNYVKETTI